VAFGSPFLLDVRIHPLFLAQGVQIRRERLNATD
jgi:hypothetical protein